MRELTADGAEVVGVLLEIMRGKLSVRVGNAKVLPTIKERIEAARELLDRGWGKAMQSLEVVGEDGGPVEVGANLAALSDEQLRQLGGLVALVETPAEVAA